MILAYENGRSQFMRAAILLLLQKNDRRTLGNCGHTAIYFSAGVSALSAGLSVLLSAGLSVPA